MTKPAPPPAQRTKKQHFIPRFLLSNFAEPPTGCIHIYDFERATLLPPQAPQAAFAKRFYYDNDNEVENFLAGGIEGPAAPVIKAFLEKNCTIPFQVPAELLKFIGAQLGRTPAARAETEGMMKGTLALMLRQFLRAKGYSDEDANGVEAVPNNPRGLHAWRIAQATLSSFLFFDLELAVLDNQTDVPFILGDHPVIQYNWYLRDAHHVGALSMTAPGVQVIMPLSASRCLLLYDSHVYDVERPANGLVAVSKREDVELLNELQLRNRQRFAVSSSEKQATAVGKAGSKFEASSLLRFEQGLIEEWRKAGVGKRRDLLYNHRHQVNVGRWLSATPIRRDAPAPPRTFEHRDLKLLEAYKRLEAKVRETQESAADSGNESGNST